MPSPSPYLQEEGGLELPTPHAQHERGAGARRFHPAESHGGSLDHSSGLLGGEYPQGLDSATSALEAKPYATEESLQVRTLSRT